MNLKFLKIQAAHMEFILEENTVSGYWKKENSILNFK